MATNTRQNYRKGSVNNRTQTYNPLVKRWIKRNAETGKFIDQKTDGSAYKGVAKEVDGRRTKP